MAYSSIVKPSDYFNTKLYTGNGTNANGITGVGFQPDWVWCKQRDGADNHVLSDAVRGGNKQIYSNLTNAETLATIMLQSFNSDGFTLGTDGAVNRNGNTYASWNWKANGAGSANTDGSINSTVSANTTAGFSIVSWTGSNANATIGHGLGVVPKMIIFKNRAAATSWMVYHVTEGATKFLRLNTTDVVGTGSTPFNDTAPTSSVFSVGANGDTNGSSQAMIAYCFAEKQGYSKFGSYTGNGNADGTFIYTGFKPAFVIIKRTDSAANWRLHDNKRQSYNAQEALLQPSTSDAEISNGGNYDFDMLSNGFKLRNSGSYQNASGGTFIYMAFAEEPLVANSGTDGVPATAR